MLTGVLAAWATALLLGRDVPVPPSALHSVSGEAWFDTIACRQCETGVFCFCSHPERPSSAECFHIYPDQPSWHSRTGCPGSDRSNPHQQFLLTSKQGQWQELLCAEEQPGWSDLVKLYGKVTKHRQRATKDSD